MIKQSGFVEIPEAVRNFPAAHVVLEAQFDPAKKTIHVEKISLVNLFLVACRRVTITRLLASKLSWLLAAKSCSPSNSIPIRSEEHTSELQSLRHLVCR